jgi:hypothetical protein
MFPETGSRFSRSRFGSLPGWRGGGIRWDLGRGRWMGKKKKRRERERRKERERARERVQWLRRKNSCIDRYNTRRSDLYSYTEGVCNAANTI